jgi:hypothetical protein
MNPANGPMAEFIHSFMAIKRHIRADEIAELAAYIAGPHGGMMTGARCTPSTAAWAPGARFSFSFSVTEPWHVPC